MKLFFKILNKNIFRNVAKNNSHIIKAPKVISKKQSSKTMEAFKSFKNYINPLPNNPSDQEMISENSKESNGSDFKTINSRIHKSFNYSTKRISTLLKFRSASVKIEEPDLAEPNIESTQKRIFRPKFLRSRSFNLNKQNSHDCDILNIRDEAERDIEKEKLFKELSNNLDELYIHFSQSMDEPIKIQDINFLETTDQSAQTYFKITSHTKELLNKCLVIYKNIEKNVHKFDIEPNIKANGYRSLLRVFENCAFRLLNVLTDLNEKKNKFYFQLKLNNSNLTSSFLNSNLIKDLQTWVRLMEKLEILLQTAYEMQQINLKKFDEKTNIEEDVIQVKNYNDLPSLFVHLNQDDLKSIENKLFKLASVHQDAFFGRACGFQFCESLQRPLTGCAIALASYNDGFEAFSNKENTIQASLNSPPSLKRVSSAGNTSTLSSYGSFTNSIGKAAMSVYSSTKYIMDPDLRAKKLSHIMRKANVEFCKAFWQLTETSIVQMGSNLVTPTVTVNVIKKISLSNPLRIPRDKKNSTLINGSCSNTVQDDVEILPPKGVLFDETIRIRILSNEIRQGMQDLDKLQTYETSIPFFNNLTQTTYKAPSKNLILHVHGGGFIAHSSKSHEIYLKPWCKELQVPIVSIDYSLAPEHAFPRASEECFYVYVWCLLNKNLLGWTGEKIIVVGDSAGGVLVTNIVQRAINFEVRVPDALVPIYAPFLLTYSLSPSRLLSVMDPLLNLGILWRCLAAYSGIDFKLETERYKMMLNIDENDKVILNSSNTQFSKSESFDSNEEIKQSEQIKFNNDEKIHFAEVQSEYETNKLLTKQELLNYYEILGDSIFLIDKLRSHRIPYDQYMSPILSTDEVLSKFPRTCLIGCTDPFLDDMIEMYRRLKKLNVKADFMIVDNGSPHGFLNFQTLSVETHEAHEEALEYLRSILNDFELEEQNRKINE